MKKMSEERIKTKLSQKITDSRRLKFLELYLTPGTKYFNNGYQSAIKAGFTITRFNTKEWHRGRLIRHDRFQYRLGAYWQLCDQLALPEEGYLNYK